MYIKSWYVPGLAWLMSVTVVFAAASARQASGSPAQDQEKGIEILKKKVADVGKLAFKQDVPVRYLDLNQLKNYIATQWDAEYPTSLAENESEWLRLMGFMDRDAEKKKIDVRSIRKRLLVENAGGLYNEKTKELLTLTRYREVDFINSMVLVHELRHALQDQYFNLTALLASRPRSDFDDRRLAILAALEGDATFLMVQCSGLDAGVLTSTPRADALMSFLPIARPSLLYREPAVIKHQLMMPYIDGLRFVSAIFNKKKWKGVNRILLLPPASSEQILHPEKYLKRENPQEVIIQYEPEGYQPVHSGVIGEYYLNTLLEPKGEEFPRDYALGWGGDTFRIYKNAASYFLVWESLWDKDIYCSNFFADFKRFIERHFNVEFKKGNVKGIDFIAGRAGAGEDYFFLMKTGVKMFYTRSDNRDQMNAFIYGGNYD
jgi:hypothetical protein